MTIRSHRAPLARARAAFQGPAPRSHAPFFRIENAAAQEADLYIYDAIGWFAVDAAEFVQSLAAIKAPTINLRINSPGGDVFAGMTIFNALRAHPSTVVTHVDGLAASIASIIALAGDEIRMGTGAFVMIHDPWGGAIGNASEMRAMADLLDKVGGELAGIYAARTGKSFADVQALMSAETWWTAEEAVAHGFADTTAAPPAAAPTSAQAAWDLSMYARVPDALRAAMATPPAPKTFETVREFEAFLRDEGGLSAAAAKKLAAGGFRALTDPRDEDEPAAMLQPLADLASDIRSLIHTR